jgi:hypothetical protein
VGVLNKETGAIELNSRDGRKFRMYGDSSFARRCYLIQGIYGPWLFVYANCEQDAFDIVADESEEFEGMYVDAQVCEVISELQKELGVTDDAFYADPDVMEKIYESAEADTFTVGNCSNRLSSSEWSCSEVNRSEMFAVRGYTDRGMHV